MRLYLATLLILFSCAKLLAQEIDIASFKNPFFESPLDEMPELKIEALLNERVKINSKWYQKGDFIDGAQIVEIKENEISLKQNNALIKLKATRSSHQILID